MFEQTVQPRRGASRDGALPNGELPLTLSGDDELERCARDSSSFTLSGMNAFEPRRRQATMNLLTAVASSLS
jgi:hypothetical protein